MEIIGIVPSTRRSLFEKERPGAIYLPFARSFQSDVSFFVRFHSLPAGTEAATADLLRRTVRDVDPSLAIISLRTFQQHLDANIQLWIVRAGAALFSIFGLLLAMATAKILSRILYQVGTLDPIAFTVAPLVLAAAALVATWLPARRASHVDPIVALRTE